MSVVARILLVICLVHLSGVCAAEGRLIAINGFVATSFTVEYDIHRVHMKPVFKLSMGSDIQEFKLNEKKVRDTMIKVINESYVRDLITMEGKDKFEKKVISILNSEFIRVNIEDIFYENVQIVPLKKGDNC